MSENTPMLKELFGGRLELGKHGHADLALRPAAGATPAPAPAPPPAPPAGRDGGALQHGRAPAPEGVPAWVGQLVEALAATRQRGALTVERDAEGRIVRVVEEESP